MIGERTAEDIKIKIGSACSLNEELSLEVRGRDLVAGLPKMISVTSEEIREALEEPVRAIVDLTKITLERIPPELSADLIERGIVLAGGGSLLRGLDTLISDATGMPVHIADDPTTAVALGTGKILELESRLLRDVAVSTKGEF
jgi:rod shape-determining protein MreB